MLKKSSETSFVHNSMTLVHFQLQVPSRVIQFPFAPRKLSARGTPMLEGIKNVATNLTRARVTPFSRASSATTCISVPESFQRDELRACDRRPSRIYGGQSFATRVRTKRKMTATVSQFYLTETVISRRLERLQRHVSLPQGGRAGRAATWFTPWRVIAQNFL